MSFFHYKKFTKNIGIVTLTELTRIIKGIVILPFITKLLGAENYGIWTQLGVTIGLLSPIVLSGLPSSLVRFLPGQKDKNEIQEGFYSVLFFTAFLGSVLSLFLLIFSSFIANFFQCQPILIKILGFVILLQSLNSIIINTFRAFQEIKKYSFFSIFQSSGEALLVILSVASGLGLLGAITSLLIIKSIVFLLGLAFILQKIRIKLPDFSKLKDYLFFGIPLVFGSLSYWVVTCLDRYLIGFFLGITFVGYYSPAYTVSNVMNFFIFPFILILPPVLAKLFDENKIEEVKKYLNYSLKYFLAIAIPAVFGISVLAKSIITIFSTEEISQNSFYIIPFVTTGILLYGISNIFIRILELVKKTKIVAKIWAIAAFLNLGLNLVLIPVLGIIGAAITTFISYALGFVLIRHYSQKELKFKIDWLFIAKSLLASIIMALSIAFINRPGLLNTLIIITTGVCIYGVLMFMLKGFNKKEFQFIKSLIIKQ